MDEITKVLVYRVDMCAMYVVVVTIAMVKMRAYTHKACSLKERRYPIGCA